MTTLDAALDATNALFRARNNNGGAFPACGCDDAECDYHPRPPEHAPNPVGRPPLADKRRPAVKLNTGERERFAAAAKADGATSLSGWMRDLAEARARTLRRKGVL